MHVLDFVLFLQLAQFFFLHVLLKKMKEKIRLIILFDFKYVVTEFNLLLQVIVPHLSMSLKVFFFFCFFFVFFSTIISFFDKMSSLSIVVLYDVWIVKYAILFHPKKYSLFLAFSKRNKNPIKRYFCFYSIFFTYYSPWLTENKKYKHTPIIQIITSFISLLLL